MLNKETVCQQFGRFLLRVRTERGLTQSEVATATGITQSHYSLLERGQREPTMSLAVNLCYELGVDFNDFIRYSIGASMVEEKSSTPE